MSTRPPAAPAARYRCGRSYCWASRSALSPARPAIRSAVRGATTPEAAGSLADTGSACGMLAIQEQATQDPDRQRAGQELDRADEEVPAAGRRHGWRLVEARRVVPPPPPSEPGKARCSGGMKPASAMSIRRAPTATAVATAAFTNASQGELSGCRAAAAKANRPNAARSPNPLSKLRRARSPATPRR